MSVTSEDINRAKRKFASEKEYSIEDISKKVTSNPVLRANIKEDDLFRLESRARSAGHVVGY